MRKNTIDDLTEFSTALNRCFVNYTAKAITQGFSEYGQYVNPYPGTGTFEFNLQSPDEDMAILTSILQGIQSCSAICTHFYKLRISYGYTYPLFNLSSLFHDLTQCSFSHLVLHNDKSDVDWTTLYRYIIAQPLESLEVYQSFYPETHLLALGKILATNPKIREIRVHVYDSLITFKGLQEYLHMLGSRNTHLKIFEISVDGAEKLDLVALQFNTLTSIIQLESKTDHHTPLGIDQLELEQSLTFATSNPIVSLERSTIPSGIPALDSISTGHIEWLIQSESAQSALPQAIWVCDALMFHPFAHWDLLNCEFYRILLQIHQRFFILLHSGEILEIKNLEQLNPDEPDHRKVVGQESILQQKLPAKIKDISIVVIDSYTRENILRKLIPAPRGILVLLKQSRLQQFIQGRAVRINESVETIVSELTELMRSHHQPTQLTILCGALFESKAVIINSMVEQLSKFTALQYLRIISRFSYSQLLDHPKWYHFFQHLSSQHIPALQSLNILLDPNNQQLLPILMQQQCNLHLECLDFHDINFLPAIRSSTKTAPTYLELILGQATFKTNAFLSLKNAINPAIILTKIKFEGCVFYDLAGLADELTQLILRHKVRLEIAFDERCEFHLHEADLYRQIFPAIEKYAITIYIFSEFNKYRQTLDSFTRYYDLRQYIKWKAVAELKSIPTFPRITMHKITPCQLGTLSLDSDTVENPRKLLRATQPFAITGVSPERATALSRQHVATELVLMPHAAHVTMLDTIPTDLTPATINWLTEDEFLQAHARKKADVYYSKCTISLEPDTLYPLATFETAGDIVCATLNGINHILSWHSNNRGQYYLRLPSGVNATTISVQSLVKPIMLPLQAESAIDAPLLPPAIHHWLKSATAALTAKDAKIAKELTPFANLCRALQTASPDRQFEIIIQYCTVGKPGGFRAQALQKSDVLKHFISQHLPKDTSLHTALQELFMMVVQQCGKCRHVVIVAAILLRYFLFQDANIDMAPRIFFNDIHVLLETPRDDKDGKRYWHTYDLGGGRRVLKIQPLAVPSAALPVKLADAKLSVARFLMAQPGVKRSEAKWLTGYQCYQQQHPPLATRDSLIDALLTTRNPRLLVVDDKAVNNLTRWLRHYSYQPRYANSGCTFIVHNAIELMLAGLPALDGSTPSPSSLAYTLTKQQPGIVLIDARHLKDNELAKCNSMLDKKSPKFNNQALHPQLKIIIVHSPDKPIEGTVEARTSLVSYQAALLQEPPSGQNGQGFIQPYNTKQSYPERSSINCYEDPLLAHLLLFGRVLCDERGWRWEPGAIYWAMYHDRPLVISGLPEERKLHEQLFNILYSGCYINPFHQQVMTINPGGYAKSPTQRFAIYQDDTPLAPLHSDKLQLLSTAPANCRRHFYLSTASFLEFIAGGEITPEGHINYYALLEQYSNDDIIWLTGPVKLAHMHLLLNQVAHTDKVLRFCLQPGVTPPPRVTFTEIKVTTPRIEQPFPTSSVLTASTLDEYDRMYRRLHLQHIHCYSVSKSSSYDILEIINIKKVSEQKTLLSAEPSDLIKRQQRGEKIAIFGEVIPSLAKCLEKSLGHTPLFKGKPLKGKLIWIKPPRELPVMTAHVNGDSWDQAYQKLNTALLSTARFLCITGPAGAGKTHALKECAKEHKDIEYFASHEIKEWLKKGGLLHLDEANREDDGFWEWIRDAVLADYVLYQGKEYQLTEQHRIAVTQNPSHYPGCQPHGIFTRYFTHIELPAMEPLVLARFTLPKLPTDVDTKAIINLIMLAVQEISRALPYYPLTLRNLFAIAAEIKRKHAALDKTSLLFKTGQACINELTGILPEAAKQDEFIHKIAQAAETTADKLLHPTGDQQEFISQLALEQDFSVPKERYLPTLQLIELLHAQNPKFDTNSRKCILLQGDSGIGKTALCKAGLRQLGIIFIELGINVPVKGNLATHLLTAYHEGWWLLIDEINLLNEGMLALLLSLLEGRDDQQRPPTKPGFAVLLTQNPQHSYQGRKALSAALLNRCKLINVVNYSASALESIAQHSLRTHPDVKRLSRAITIIFTELRNYYAQRGWHEINYHKFFATLDAIIAGKLHQPEDCFFYLLHQTRDVASARADDDIKKIASTITSQLDEPKEIYLEQKYPVRVVNSHREKKSATPVLITNAAPKIAPPSPPVMLPAVIGYNACSLNYIPRLLIACALWFKHCWQRLSQNHYHPALKSSIFFPTPGGMRHVKLPETKGITTKPTFL